MSCPECGHPLKLKAFNVGGTRFRLHCCEPCLECFGARRDRGGGQDNLFARAFVSSQRARRRYSLGPDPDPTYPVPSLHYFNRSIDIKIGGVKLVTEEP